MTPAILLITALAGPMEGSQSYVLYESLDACHSATSVVSDTLGYDHSLDCIAGGLVSSPRPVRNPIYEVME